MKNRKIACTLWLLACLLTATDLWGQRIVFTPQWTVQSQFAGYYVAQEKGFYREAGLDVTITHPSASNPALNSLLEGTCQVTTLQLITAMECIDRGLPLTNILQTSQRNSLMIVPRSNDIQTLEDLKGKKIGIWKAGFGELGYMMNRDKKLDIRWIPFINSINLFVSKAIDATLAMSYNEYLQIQASGIRPDTVFHFDQLGYDIPEDGVYTTHAYYQTHRKELEAFAKASARGWQWAAQHPEEAVDIVMKYVQKEHAGTNRVHQKRMLETMLKLQCDRHSNIPTFRLEPHHIKQTSDLLLRHGRIWREITYEEITGKQ